MLVTIEIDLDPPKALEHLREALIEETRDWLADEVQATLKEAEPYTPIKTGRLRRSGRASGVDNRGDTLEASVTSGSAEAYYAGKVHEEYTYHKPPTRWKYLEYASSVRMETRERELRARLNARLADAAR